MGTLQTSCPICGTALEEPAKRDVVICSFCGSRLSSLHRDGSPVYGPSYEGSGGSGADTTGASVHRLSEEITALQSQKGQVKTDFVDAKTAVEKNKKAQSYLLMAVVAWLLGDYLRTLPQSRSDNTILVCLVTGFFLAALILFTLGLRMRAKGADFETLIRYAEKEWSSLDQQISTLESRIKQNRAAASD